MRAFLSRKMWEKFGYPQRFELRKSGKTNVVFGLHVGGFGYVFGPSQASQDPGESAVAWVVLKMTFIMMVFMPLGCSS